jgi:moderate conductance mechanosensitive channel
VNGTWRDTAWAVEDIVDDIVPVRDLASWLNENWLDVIFSLLAVIVIVAAAALLARFARRAVQRWVSQATVRTLERADDVRQMRAELRATTLGRVLSDAATFVIWGIAIITALGQIGIELAPLIAGAGIAGLALGFGAQSLIRDFLSGFFILLEDQYGVGDVITITPEVSGKVEEISLRVTRLRSLDGTVWFVPNGEIRQLGNRSKEWARALVDFEVAYREDLTEVLPVIQQVAASLRRDPEIGPKILEDVEILGVEQFGASGIQIRTFIKTLPLEQFPVARRFRQEVKAAFDELGIEIPFPHRKIVFAEDDRTSPAKRHRLGPPGRSTRVHGDDA